MTVMHIAAIIMTIMTGGGMIEVTGMTGMPGIIPVTTGIIMTGIDVLTCKGIFTTGLTAVMATDGKVTKL